MTILAAALLCPAAEVVMDFQARLNVARNRYPEVARLLDALQFWRGGLAQITSAARALAGLGLMVSEFSTHGSPSASESVFGDLRQSEFHFAS